MLQGQKSIDKAPALVDEKLVFNEACSTCFLYLKIMCCEIYVQHRR